LLSSINRLPVKVETIETAVGDRWLSHALRSSLVMDSQMPRIIGVEDSGHAVLPSPHPHNEQNWSLVGDGAATLLAYLLARSTAQEDMLMMRGWKQRVSVQHVRRELWDGNNPLSDEIERIARSHLEQCGKITQWNRHGLEGEENLMLIEALLGGAPLSLGIRNSGTQAKISISLRLSSSIESEKVALVMPKLAEQLANAMC
jgi:phosphomannomutase